MSDELAAVAATTGVQPGWDVYTADGERLGAVDEVGADGFTVEPPAGGTVHLEFGDIESADDGRVDLALSGDELPRDEPSGDEEPFVSEGGGGEGASTVPGETSPGDGRTRPRPEQAEGPDEPGEGATERPPRPSQAEGDREE